MCTEKNVIIKMLVKRMMTEDECWGRKGRIEWDGLYNTWTFGSVDKKKTHKDNTQR